MPLDIKNIDKKAALPEDIDFRKEMIWEKIQTRKKSKLRLFWPWMVAAMVILGFGLSLLKNSKPVEIAGQEIDLIASNSVHDFPELENPVLDFQVPDLIERRIPVQKTEVKEIAKQPETKAVFSDEISIFKSIVAEPIKPLEIASNEQLYSDLHEEKKLSPAAMRLKRNLQKMDKENVPDQTMVVEKFNLLRELQGYPMEASAKQNPTSIYNQLNKRINE
ncbi:hypothetical protein [Algoriphagus formosus]|uniref:hypothetical protein n=1 Tax=Algoriphagus formosus TaxID=2007308 RepID=UPI000C286E6E|nr:hypothetical protein [Algoriphagus formosus]